jgi:NADH-quinone oxidoreductase subunit C
MSEHLQTAIQTLEGRFGAEAQVFREQTTAFVDPENIVEVCRTLRDEFDFNMLANETAVDYWPQEEPRFHIVYLMHSLPHNLYLGLRVPVNGQNPIVPTIEGLFPNANWHEREIWDMFGVRFEGHSDIRRILMPYDWEGHPLRKDYPLGYEEVQFTFNFDEIDLRKPYVKE